MGGFPEPQPGRSAGAPPLVRVTPLQPSQGGPMASLLVNITHGPEDPFRAALGLLVARTAQTDGHEVTLFLAGDAVQLIRDAVLDSLVGLGSGPAREHFDEYVKAGGKIYLSGMSSKARGVTDADLEGKPAEFVMPTVLVKLAMEADKALVY
jgi:uncharacterized protein